MASSYTSRIRLEKQADGENPNSWGLIMNQNVIDRVDEAVAGYTVVSVSSVAVSLTTNEGSTDEARNATLELAGALTADVTVTFPAQEKTYFVHNNTSGNFDVLLKPTGGTLVTATDQGSAMMVATNGSVVRKLETSPRTKMDVQTASGTASITLKSDAISTYVRHSGTGTLSIGAGQYDGQTINITSTGTMTLSWHSGSQGVSLGSSAKIASGIWDNSQSYWFFSETVT